RNWTQVHIPTFRPPPVPPFGPPNLAFPSNDETKPDEDPLGSTKFAQGNYDVVLAVDPNNPNVVYMGGTDDGQPSPAGGFIRVDTTGVADPYAFVPYDNSNPDGGAIMTATTGRLSLATRDFSWGLIDPNTGALRGYDPRTGQLNGYLNLLRDPDNPFLTNSTLKVQKSQ